MLSQPVGWVERNHTKKANYLDCICGFRFAQDSQDSRETQHLTVRVLKHDIATDAVDENRKRLKS